MLLSLTIFDVRDDHVHPSWGISVTGQWVKQLAAVVGWRLDLVKAASSLVASERRLHTRPRPEECAIASRQLPQPTVKHIHTYSISHILHSTYKHM